MSLPKKTSPNENLTRLMVAVVNSDVATVEAVLEQGVEVDERDKEEQRTALIMASTITPDLPRVWDRVTIVQKLLDKGADANAVDKNCRTALMVAAWNGTQTTPSELEAGVQLNIVTALIEAGADTDRVDIVGYTALKRAEIAGHKGIQAALELAELEAANRRRPNLDSADDPALIQDVIRSFRFWPGVSARVICLLDEPQVRSFCKALEYTRGTGEIPGDVKILELRAGAIRRWVEQIQNSGAIIAAVSKEHQGLADALCSLRDPAHYMLFYGFGFTDLEERQHKARKDFLKNEAEAARRAADEAMMKIPSEEERTRVKQAIEAHVKVEEAEKELRKAQARADEFHANLARLRELKMRQLRIRRCLRKYSGFDMLARGLEAVPVIGENLQRKRRQREARIKAIEMERATLVSKLTGK